MKDLPSTLQIIKSFIFNVWVNPDQLGALQQVASDVYVKSNLNCKIRVETMDTKRQIIKASTSSGANYEESQGAPTKPDVRSKIAISLKEMREANYFFRIYHHLKLGDVEKSKHLVNESLELKRILGSILTKLSIIFISLNFGLAALNFAINLFRYT